MSDKMSINMSCCNTKRFFDSAFIASSAIAGYYLGLPAAITALGAYYLFRRSRIFPQNKFLIQVNSRAGNLTPISVQIGNVEKFCSHLIRTNLGDFFCIANASTVNQPYPLGDKPLRDGSLIAYRPNHNGTHSARQAAHLDALYDLIKNKGSKTAEAAYNSLTGEEKMNLRLAAYFLRAGRVDESSHKVPPADDYYTRSASIYEAYAKQLKVNRPTVEWIKKLIRNSCKPSSVRDKDIDTDPKNKFGYEILTMVHELDLIRCFNPSKFQRAIESMEKRLDYFISDSRTSYNKRKYIKPLLEYAKDLCAVTGCRRAYDNARGNKKLFAECSTDGKLCWQKVKSVPIPHWD